MRPPHDRAEARDGGNRDHDGEDLATPSVDAHEQGIPRRRRNGIGFVRDGPSRRIEPYRSYRLTRPVDGWTVAGGGPADVHFFLISSLRRVLRRRPSILILSQIRFPVPTPDAPASVRR